MADVSIEEIFEVRFCCLLILSNDTIIKKPTNRLSVVIIIIVELVNQINPKYNWHDIQKSIRNLCKNNDERALLLGFNSLESAKNITSSIKDKKA